MPQYRSTSRRQPKKNALALVTTIAGAILCIVVGVLVALNAQKERDGYVPSSAQIWHGKEYELAARAFANHKAALPRLADKEGAALVHRMTSPENLRRFQSKSTPAQTRLDNLGGMLTSFAAMTKLYAEQSKLTRSSYPSESIPLAAFSWRLTVAHYEALEDVSLSQPTNASLAEKRRQVGASLTTNLEQLFEVSRETASYSEVERSEILDALNETWETVARTLDDQQRAAVLTKVQSLHAAFMSDTNKRYLLHMAEHLEPKSPAQLSASAKDGLITGRDLSRQ